jgi:hypothetical protein
MLNAELRMSGALQRLVLERSVHQWLNLRFVLRAFDLEPFLRLVPWSLLVPARPDAVRTGLVPCALWLLKVNFAKIFNI